MTASFLNRLRSFIFILSVAILGGCGDDDFNNVPPEVAPEPEPAAIENMVSGSVIKGPVSGSVVIIYAFDGTTELGRGETAADGSFTISIGENAGGVVVSASGGTYTDEATGAKSVQFGSVEMRAAYMVPESMTPPFDVTINVTPFTELAVREALVDGAVDAQLIAQGNEDFFELGANAIDILTTIPTNPLTGSVAGGTPEDLYGMYLAMVSQILQDQGLGSWDEAVSLLETTENEETIIATALNALAASDSAAGANITLAAAVSALEALGVTIDAGGDTGGDTGGDSDGDMGGGSDGDTGGDIGGGSGSSGAMPCLVGSAETTTIPSGLASTVGDLTLSFAAAGSNLTQGVVQNFTFSSSGSLFVDDHLIAETLYTCGGNASELLWYEELMDRIYSVSFKADGSFNEVNLNSGDGTFLGQYTDENGDFANVTNADSSGGDSGGVGVVVDGASGTFTLSITGTVAAKTAGVSVAVNIPTVTINNIAAPNANDDFKTVIENSGFNVSGTITVTTINNTADRVTFNLKFDGSNAGVDSSYDLTYDYQK